MNQVRFNRVQDLFETFPTAEGDVGHADVSMQSLEFLNALTGKLDWEPAISFCAYLLPRRVAVAWACRSIRRMVERFDAGDERAISFAEAWVAEPEETRRRKALALGNLSDPRAPTTWLALAAGWAGGSVVPAELGHVVADPEQTARAVRVALFIALSGMAKDVKDRVMTVCLEDGIQLARGEPDSSR
jgi:hypothetical protein